MGPQQIYFPHNNESSLSVSHKHMQTSSPLSTSSSLSRVVKEANYLAHEVPSKTNYPAVEVACKSLPQSVCTDADVHVR